MAVGTGRFGYPATGSSTHSTHSGGFSHRSRSSTSRRAASAMAMARGSSAYSAAGMSGVRPSGNGKVWKSRGGMCSAVVAYAQPGAQPQRPEFMKAAVKDAEGRVVIAGNSTTTVHCRDKRAVLRP